MSVASLSAPEATPRAAILGCKGPRLLPDERRLFRETAPLGFILFQRNCPDPASVRALTAELRDAVGRADAPVLIDQEGGRVARLRPPHWHPPPAAAHLGRLWRADPEGACQLARTAGRLIADDLHPLGIDVACAPVLDVAHPGAHDVIGDRAFATDPDVVAALGRAVAEGLLAGGVLPVVKHVPGHGRAMADSHDELPVVDAAAEELAVDLAPFRALADMPIAMTAHVLYPAWDAAAPATTSPAIVREIIRGLVGFDGLLLSDDLSMKALGGSMTERATAALRAGCDVLLHCNGDLAEMTAVAAAATPMSAAASRRWAAARARLGPPEPFDRAAACGRLDALAA